MIAIAAFALSLILPHPSETGENNRFDGPPSVHKSTFRILGEVKPIFCRNLSSFSNESPRVYRSLDFRDGNEKNEIEEVRPKFADQSRAIGEGDIIRTGVFAVPYPAARIKKPENIDPNKELSSSEKRIMIMTGLAVLIAAIAFGFLVRSKTK